ncbi:hypothetical protein C8N25_13517 [Algoriphagus antarcticus]|uniref:Uncharacterized protein n=1 Tax=Algoriphagus antarcticus TaxID=238540 RepID=A0A3E0D8G7_9BACT|nr:hypothetical protein C8N25_13517 [Algoriphagus antarcticus]
MFQFLNDQIKIRLEQGLYALFYLLRLNQAKLAEKRIEIIKSFIPLVNALYYVIRLFYTVTSRFNTIKECGHI